MLSAQSLPFSDETHILLVFLLRFLEGWYSLVLVVGSEVDEVTELSFGHGGDSSGGRAVVRLTRISNLEHDFVYKSSQSSKYLVWLP